MRGHGTRVKARRRSVPATHSDPRPPVAPHALARDFDPGGPNESWWADITDIPTGEGWLYLAVVEDLLSRMAVGWSMAATMESRLAVDAPEMAVTRRPGAGLLAHSDRGTQYASDHYRRVRAGAGIVCSMSGDDPACQPPGRRGRGRVRRRTVRPVRRLTGGGDAPGDPAGGKSRRPPAPGVPTRDVSARRRGRAAFEAVDAGRGV